MQEHAAIVTKEHFQLSDSVEEIWEEWGRLAKNAYDNEVRMKPGAAEYLRMLKKSGVRIGAATSNHEELFSGTLKRCGVYDYFDAFTMTSEVSRGKDFPDVYLLCAERLGNGWPRDVCVQNGGAVAARHRAHGEQRGDERLAHTPLSAGNGDGLFHACPLMQGLYEGRLVPRGTVA